MREKLFGAVSPIGLLAVALVAAAISLLVWCSGQERRAIGKMEAADRRALFEETLAGFHTLCEPLQQEALRPRCRAEAEFLLQFPECDEACQILVAPHLGSPTR
jgi:cytochrome b pre-mRNA-processing protein 3